MKCSSIDDLKEFRDGEVTILFGREFQVSHTLFTKKLSLIVAQEQKLFLTLELNDSLRMLRLFPRTLNAGPDIFSAPCSPVAAQQQSIKGESPPTFKNLKTF